MAGKNAVLGTLYIPNKYKTAWIIDGQHRLFGYANLDDNFLAQNIFVVAFEKMPIEEEANLFVTINHEQKSVPKNLLDDLEGETIALSNLGAYDIDSFFGIVPPPASVILAAGNTLRRAVPIGGNVTTKKLTSFTLAADGTVITEPYAARFLTYFAEVLKNPQELI